MPFDGSGRFIRTDGTRTGPRVWRDAAARLIRINAPDFDEHDNDFARGLENCLTRDGQTSATADQPMGGHRHLQIAGALRRDQYSSLGQLLDQTMAWVPSSGVAGTGNDVELTVDALRSGYRSGFGYRWAAKSGNTGPMTVTEGAHGKQAMVREDGEPFAGGEIVTGQLIDVRYDSSRFVANVGRRFWSGTQAQRDNLSSIGAGVVYLILPTG